MAYVFLLIMFSTFLHDQLQSSDVCDGISACEMFFFLIYFVLMSSGLTEQLAFWLVL